MIILTLARQLFPSLSSTSRLTVLFPKIVMTSFYHFSTLNNALNREIQSYNKSSSGQKMLIFIDMKEFYLTSPKLFTETSTKNHKYANRI